MAIFSRLIPVAVSAFSLQLGLASVFVPRAEDRFYDLSGAAGFLTTTLVSIYYPFVRSRLPFLGASNGAVPLSHLCLAPRQLLLTEAVVMWTGRLGAFLAQRAFKAGGDSRFDEIKHDKLKFTGAWIAQATWVFVVGLPVYLSNLVPPSAHRPLRALDYASLALIAASFALEVTADLQKSAWRHARDSEKHDQKFITSGLWGWSRHPNYVGEVGIWAGMWSLAAFSGALPWPAVLAAAASPLGTYFLIRHVSGVPPLERAGEKKFGDDPKWKEYKRSVPVFFPWGGYE
ncbi:hypothetical protein PAXINDRAFT_85504 [Paxillus involutus ATCC 200175]|uniref:Steroid 5-alpha reductase C-terminal domain-containing protein n=1 Tax=Paxillus involutus ATCC 200175 TaxID=664439 RepID=A0A0C9T530_PAXIN|nr:hypothetical protein PAXINDRAFT_85504 [Paxillus involutus ATCC 200175]